MGLRPKPLAVACGGPLPRAAPAGARCARPGYPHLKDGRGRVVPDPERHRVTARTARRAAAERGEGVPARGRGGLGA